MVKDEKVSAEQTVRDIRRQTRRKYNTQEKIRIVVEGPLKDPHFFNECYKALGKNDWSTMWWVPGPLRVFAKRMVLMDDPSHARLHNLVQKGFTHRMIQQMETRIEKISHTLLDKALKTFSRLDHRFRTAATTDCYLRNARCPTGRSAEVPQADQRFS